MILGGYVCLLAGGCTAGRAFRAGENLEQKKKYEEAMFSYAEALQRAPEVSEYRVRFLSARDKAANERFNMGIAKFNQGDFAAALPEFQTAYLLDPSQGRYKQLADESARNKDAQQAFREGEEFERANKLKDAYRLYGQALAIRPEQKEYKQAMNSISERLFSKTGGFELNLQSAKPFALNLREAGLKESFRILSQLSGISFLFDEEIKDPPVSISLEKTSFHQVLDLLLTMNKLSCKMLNKNTLLIFSKTPEKIKQYEEMEIRTFHLNYMDAKNAANLVRAMVPTRKLHVNEAANSLVVRDTSSVINVVEKLLDANDYPDAEVLLDVEVIELTDQNSKNVGLILSRYAVDLGPFDMGSKELLADKLSGVNTTSAKITNLVQAFSWNGYGGFVTVPSASYNFGKTIAKGEVLSNPKIRVKNKEKAKFNIGTRVPITTTTTSGSGSGYSVNVQYVDVGVKVDAEPIIQRNNDVEIKLNLEVSSIISREKIGDGTTTVVTIGTRNLQTVLSLKDGETSVIGGLISRTNSDSKSKVFLLGDIPLVGPMLSGTSSSKDKTELLLAITPRLVRGISISPQNLASFMSGKEDEPSLGLFPEPIDQAEENNTEKQTTDKIAGTDFASQAVVSAPAPLLEPQADVSQSVTQEGQIANGRPPVGVPESHSNMKHLRSVQSADSSPPQAQPSTQKLVTEKPAESIADTKAEDPSTLTRASMAAHENEAVHTTEGEVSGTNEPTQATRVAR